ADPLNIERESAEIAARCHDNPIRTLWRDLDIRRNAVGPIEGRANDVFRHAARPGPKAEGRASANDGRAGPDNPGWTAVIKRQDLIAGRLRDKELLQVLQFVQRFSCKIDCLAEVLSRL